MRLYDGINYSQALSKERNILSFFNSIMMDEDESILLRFSSFVFIFTVIRLENHPLHLLPFVENAPDEIKEIPVYKQYLVDAINSSALDDSIEHYYKLLQYIGTNLRNNPASLNVASQLLLNLVTCGFFEEGQAGQYDYQKLINNYVAHMRNAIEVENNPTFNVTLGRLLTLQGKDFNEARRKILFGISNYMRDDRESRILVWSGYLRDVDAAHNQLRLKNEIDKKVAEYKENNEKNVNKLRFENIKTMNVLNNNYMVSMTVITTIVALIVTSATLSTRVELSDAIILLGIFSSILAVFLILLIVITKLLNKSVMNSVQPDNGANEPGSEKQAED